MDTKQGINGNMGKGLARDCSGGRKSVQGQRGQEKGKEERNGPVSVFQ